MPAIEIVLAICLTGPTPTCSEARILLHGVATPTACMMRAMPFVAQWAGANPQYEIKNWTCSAVGERDA